MSEPLVSIIMPVYNAGDYLGPAVQSVFAQTFTSWELLTVDDCSSDNSFSYLQRIADPRVRVLRTSVNSGTPVAINLGIDAARGRYIARMDADDIILPNRLERQVAALEADPKIDLLGTGTFLVDRELSPIQVRRPVTSHREIVSTPTLYYQLTFGALMGKADWWRRWRIDPRVRVSGHEFDLYLRSHRDSIFSNVPDPLYVYRFVGHTRSWKKLTTSVYLRSMSLIRHGFKPGLRLQTLLALATMVPRPLLYALKLAIGSTTGLVSAGANDLTDDDRAFLKAGLEQVAQVTVPLQP